MRTAADLPAYDHIIQKMMVSLTKQTNAPEVVGEMVNCIWNHWGNMATENNSPKTNKNHSLVYDGPGFDSETDHITIKPCDAGYSFIYDVTKKSACCFEEMHRTKDFIFERIHIHETQTGNPASCVRKNKSNAQKGLKQKNVFFATHYYRVVAVSSEKSIGYLHVYPIKTGLKEIRYNAKASQKTLHTASVEFLETYGKSYYTLRAACFTWTAEATYMIAVSNDPLSAANPKFQLTNYMLVPGKQTGDLIILSQSTGADCGSMTFTGNGKDVEVWFDNRKLGVCRTPAQGLFLTELIPGKNQPPF
ncbi:MAG: hypothetical protein ACKOX7_03080 [Bacteroidota bacterium]